MLLHFLWNLIAFIIALGILITVHELGHFLTARCFRVRVERFSIGFGPVLWRWRDSSNTEYVISMILFGGYVKLFNSEINHTMDHNSSVKNAFNHKSFWKRIIVILSGSIFNLIFSILSYILIYMIGVPMYKPIIHNIIPNSIISQSKIPLGVEIKSVNNIQTPDWEAVRFQILNNIEKEKLVISTKSINDANFCTYTVNLPKYWFDAYFKIQDPIIALGILPPNAQIVPILSYIQSNSVAERSGLKVGDKILAINDQLIFDWESFITYIKTNPEKNFKISIERKNRILSLRIILDKNHLIYSNIIEEMIGIFPKIVITPEKNYIAHHCGLYNAIYQACSKTWELIYLTVNTLIKFIVGDIKIINIGGPIAIAQGAGGAAQFGLIYYLMFLSIISINLGIINLLPFPTLDGGHLFFLILEKIKGKPISERIQNFGNIIGFFLLVLIMCFSFFNDISKLW